MFLVFALVCAGAVTLVAAKISGGPLAMWREVQANLQGGDVTSAGPGAIEKIAAMVFPSNADATRDLIDFLPPAPDGWVRITPEDAALPKALDAIKARWPQGNDVLPVEQNLGYKHLVSFLERKAKPDAERQVLPKTATSALYLSGNGEFLHVQLEHTSELNALGAKNDPDSWIEALAAIEEKSLQSGELLERLVLGDVAATNQTKPAGESPLVRPIGADVYATNGLKLAIPLSNRAILRMQGEATPILAQALIASIDRDGLLARLD